ncbi:hypothetical protein APHAL10511_007268 [Amanita phalloides]|nr:hypothetical protein APHAL10511_007268 [Amanita phalloides]
MLYKPFALAPCGHVACYDCLVRWFTAPALGADDENVNRGHATAAGNVVTGNHIHKRKTCPICRVRVSERPVEVWDIKNMVNALVRCQLVDIVLSTSAEEISSSSNNDRNGQASGNSALDPWHRIFRPVRNAYGNNRQFNPWWRDWNGNENMRPPERVDGPLEDVGMYDAEDHVYRCLDCMHEIWDGRCSACGRGYHGHPEMGEDEDEDEDGDEDEDDVIDLDEDYSDNGVYGYGLSLGEMLEQFEGGMDMWPFEERDSDDEQFFSDEYEEDGWEGGIIYRGTGPVVWDNEDEDEVEEGIAHVEEVEEEQEDEEGYESSFIDDGEDERDGTEEMRRSARLLNRDAGGRWQNRGLR